ncbi:hypothetical protein [uncultured Methylibium sp.]|uniref:hypothetical protein n=1 Tax=uncultured Methylibium sp. TaxID=381093 RepID=UPI0025FC7011|nr:hypothetical protein [uncultured Methylibium sp.]
MNSIVNWSDVRGRFAVGAGVALAGLALSSGARAIDCQLGCVAPKDASCELRTAAGVKTDVSRTELRTTPACELLTAGTVANGRFELRYRHKGRWFTPPEGVEPGPLKRIFDKYPPDPCGVPSPACIQARMNGMVAAIGGHGIDNKDSKPGGEGNPCQIALPCGVVLPPPETWNFRLAGAAISGTWTVKLARGTPPAGQPPEVSVYIDKGVARLSGTWFAPGTQYVYRFVDDAGRASSTGEFSVASRATRDTLQTLMQRRVAQGLPEGIAWADTLAANNHDWDAFQLSLISQEPR